MDSATEPRTESLIRIDPRVGELRERLATVIRGKDDVIEQVILALLSEGSLLMEDVPGVGKTTLAKALAALLEMEYQRVQCTPDLLPADVFGFSIFNQKEATFEFRPGPVFCNLLLLDEINRASPRTQSALLEAMAERQVTVEGTRYPLDPPFIVFATQNPSTFHGTFPLLESQMDRFVCRLSMDYPDAESEIELLYDQTRSNPLDRLEPVLTRTELMSIQDEVRKIRFDRLLAEYLVAIVANTRTHPAIQLGCSPRGTQMFFRASQARAYLNHRDFVLPDDIQDVARLVLEHRIVVRSNRDSAASLVDEILDSIEVPV